MHEESVINKTLTLAKNQARDIRELEFKLEGYALIEHLRLKKYKAIKVFDKVFDKIVSSGEFGDIQVTTNWLSCRVAEWYEIDYKIDFKWLRKNPLLCLRVILEEYIEGIEEEVHNFNNRYKG